MLRGKSRSLYSRLATVIRKHYLPDFELFLCRLSDCSLCFLKEYINHDDYGYFSASMTAFGSVKYSKVLCPCIFGVTQIHSRTYLLQLQFLFISPDRQTAGLQHVRLHFPFPNPALCLPRISTALQPDACQLQRAQRLAITVHAQRLRICKRAMRHPHHQIRFQQRE